MSGLSGYFSRNSFNSASASSASCRSEEHTSELQSRLHLVCRLLLEKKKTNATHFAPDGEKNDARACPRRRSKPPPASPTTCATARRAPTLYPRLVRRTAGQAQPCRS